MCCELMQRAGVACSHGHHTEHPTRWLLVAGISDNSVDVWRLDLAAEGHRPGQSRWTASLLYSRQCAERCLLYSMALQLPVRCCGLHPTGGR